MESQRALKEFGKPAQPIGVHSPGHIADSDERAREELWPHFSAMMNRIGRERGWPPRDRRDVDREAGPDGALYVGAPETVARKIAHTVQLLGMSRFDLKYSNGTMPPDVLMRSIELYGREVVPWVQAAATAETRLPPRPALSQSEL